jgi:protein-S-isoprenylcysteine O-methyltransferase Ste14
MTLIPVFKIGIWNAWIFVIIFLIPTFVLPFLNNLVHKKLSNPTDMKVSASEKVVGYIATIIIYMVFIYAIFLPFKLGTAWFYAGLFIFLLAMISLISACISFFKTSIDEPVTRGIYRYSRHPFYLSNILVSIGIGIATASWIILLVSMVFLILANIVAIYEEYRCIERYGKTYKKYLNTVPRWIGIPRL